jgi:tRNA (guanine10-N2)-methyltransferase
MKDPEQVFTLFEEFPIMGKSPEQGKVRVQDKKGSLIDELEPTVVYLGRLIGNGGREAMNVYSLKKRLYLSTTSMDAELALIMANMTLAKPGSLFYDPFVGTGSLTVACAHFGAFVLGSDIDGRSIRGKEGLNLHNNYAQYGLHKRDLGGMIADLVNSPIRGWRGHPQKDDLAPCEWLDGIVCDPPYGVREGLRVLGKKDDEKKEIVFLKDGKATHL